MTFDLREFAKARAWELFPRSMWRREMRRESRKLAPPSRIPALNKAPLDSEGFRMICGPSGELLRDPRFAETLKRDRAAQRAWRTGSPQRFPYLRQWLRRRLRR